MKACTFCGHNNRDESAFCVMCGNALAAESEQAQTFNSANTQQCDKINIDFPKNTKFVSSDEYVVATLSNGIALNIISGEGLKSEDAVLTNRRLYYTHKTGGLTILSQEERVNVKDITGTKIANSNPIVILILAILVLFVGIIAFPPLCPAALVLVAIYFIIKKAHLRIEYAGGAIYFSVKKYGKEKIQTFQKCIYAVKDYIDANNNC